MSTAGMSSEQRDALRAIAAGDVCFDPRFYGFCGADRDVVDELVSRGLATIDWTRDQGCHPRYPRHPVHLTALGLVAIAVHLSGAAR